MKVNLDVDTIMKKKKLYIEAKPVFKLLEKYWGIEAKFIGTKKKKVKK